MRSYKEKRKEFSPEAQVRISAGADQIRSELCLLRAIRERSGMSQEELATRLEVGQSYISRLERRNNTTLATLARIVHALGGSIDVTINIPQHGSIRFSDLQEEYGGPLLVGGISQTSETNCSSPTDKPLSDRE